MKNKRRKSTRSSTRRTKRTNQRPERRVRPKTQYRREEEYDEIAPPLPKRRRDDFEEYDEPKKKNGNSFVRWVNTHVDNVRLALGVLIFICSILILNNNLNVKSAYITSSQSLYSVLLMGKSTNDLTMWAREYVITGDEKYKQKYDEHLLERNGDKADRRGVTKAYTERFREIPNNIVPESDKQKLLDSLSASDFLALKEKEAFKLVESGDLESARNCVFGDEYEAQKEKIISPLLEFTDKVTMDIGKMIVVKIMFSYGYIILLCAANLVLIFLINDRLDFHIRDEEE